MSHRPVCPHCGIPLDDLVARDQPGAAEPPAPPEEAAPPGAEPTAPESAALMDAPNLEPPGFVTPASGELPRVSSSDGEIACATASSSGEAAAAVREPDATPAAPAPGGDGLVLIAPSRSGSVEHPAVHAGHRRRVTWGTFLLASYASALTLSMAWLIVTGRIRSAPATHRVADAHPAAREASRAALPRLPADHLTDIGQPIRLGAIEITPLSIALEPVTLRSAFDPFEQRDGGVDALHLRLRVRNLRESGAIRPIDLAFLRRPDTGPSESVIETNGAVIEMYPLALSSEWTLDGQDFRTLEPGDEMDVTFVSEPDVTQRLTPRMTWRFRVRVDSGRTELVGIRFGRSELSE